MKRFIFYTLALFIFFGVGMFVFFYRENSSNLDVDSPIPDFLNKEKNSQVSSIDIWSPILQKFFSSNNTPEISAKSALVYDLTDGKVLYEKNAREKLPMASLTKIMTAIVAMDHKRSDDMYNVYPESLVGENVMGLTSGEILSLNELLHGLVLNSGNDAAEVIASNTMNRTDFIKAMNDKAKSLGLKDTNFTNPSGLEGEGNQYTTSYDLLVITKYALNNYPEFAEVVSTPEYHMPATEEHKAYDLYNETNLLTSYPGVKGVKDGFTDEAGLCLVTYLDYKDHKIIGVILGSQNRRAEMKELLDYSLSTQGIKPPPHS
ncbi:MAG: D-alanyl-D-alanine carboxypeptidase family protein [Patescibacteria group bacterium]